MNIGISGWFNKIWKGGYFEGDPTDPMAESSYGVFGYYSALYLTYRVCIKPFVGSDTNVLEIGPGRGAWTKAILEGGPRLLYAVDVVDADYAGFSGYIGKREEVKHIVVNDCLLADIPDKSLDYVFSFGVFCHLKPEACEQYIYSLSRKMRVGSHGFIMVADFDKVNACMEGYRSNSIRRALGGGRLAAARWALDSAAALWPGAVIQRRLVKGISGDDVPGAWYHWGVGAACSVIERAGFRVIEQDVQVSHRDPVIHFVKEG